MIQSELRLVGRKVEAVGGGYVKERFLRCAPAFAEGFPFGCKLGAEQFAQRTGLKYSTLAAWVRRYRRTKRPWLKSPVCLLAAVVAPAALIPAFEVQLLGVDRTQLRTIS